MYTAFIMAYAAVWSEIWCTTSAFILDLVPDSTVGAKVPCSQFCFKIVFFFNVDAAGLQQHKVIIYS